MYMDVDIHQVIAIVKDMKKYFMDTEKSRQITFKGDIDFATEADFSVQREVQERLLAAWQDIQFMGEEKDNSGIDFSGPVWILDPVDGTTNLVHGFGQSSVSLALSVNSELELGVVYNPFSDELFYAVRGQGAFLNGEQIHVSAASRMKEALISVGTAPYYHELADQNFERMKRIFLDCQDIRRVGSAAIDLCYVACGRTDAYYEPNINPWDYGAGALIVMEAGGCVSDFEGARVPMDRRCCLVAGTPEIHRLLLEQYLA